MAGAVFMPPPSPLRLSVQVVKELTAVGHEPSARPVAEEARERLLAAAGDWLFGTRLSRKGSWRPAPLWNVFDYGSNGFGVKYRTA